jgi:hypothetical protein
MDFGLKKYKESKIKFKNYNENLIQDGSDTDFTSSQSLMYKCVKHITPYVPQS